MPVVIERLVPGDHNRFGGLMTLFGEAFDEMDNYTGERPGAAYVDDLLASDSLIMLVAMNRANVVGGLAAYELRKFERERCEIYVYDLAVAAAYRRRGIATALLEHVGEIGSARGAWTVFVQADREDAPAVSLYSRLGNAEAVLHFDLLLPRRK